MIRPTAPAIAFACFILPLPAMAQESSGIIEGQIDGKDIQWYVTSADGQSQSDWSDMGFLASVSIFAHPSSDTISETKGAFLIGFQVFNLTADVPTIESPEVTYMQDSYKGMYGAQDNAAVTVTEATIEDGLLHIKGSFDASLSYSTDHLRTFDSGNTKQATGRFDVTLGAIKP